MKSILIRQFFVVVLSLCVVMFLSMGISNESFAGDKHATTGGGAISDDGSSGGGKKKKVKKHWKTDGNANIASDQHFLGTTDPADLVIKTDNDEKMRVTTDGNVGIGTADPTHKLHIDGDVKITGKLSVGSGTTIVYADGVQFSDGTIQTTAATGGAGGVEESSDPVSWTGTHTWKTDTGPGSGRTLKTFSGTIPGGIGGEEETILISIPVPNNSMMFLNAWVGGAISPGGIGDSGAIRMANTVRNIGGTVAVGEEENAPTDIGDIGVDVFYEVNGTNVDLKHIKSSQDTWKITGWIEYSSVPMP